MRSEAPNAEAPSAEALYRDLIWRCAARGARVALKR